MKRCLVLGGKGFIGSNLVQKLLAKGYMVRVFDRYALKDTHDHSGTSQNMEIYNGDFNNRFDLEKAVENIDVIIHLISTTLPKKSNDDPVFDVETNLLGTLNLLETIKHSPSVKFVFLSSGGTVYGIPEADLISEDHPTRPICSYGICKLAIENYLHMYHHLYGLDYVVLRVSNPFGENQNPISAQGVVPVFMHKLLKDQNIEIWGDGTVIRDFIYIGDVIDAIIMTIEKQHTNRVFNIGSGMPLTLNNLVKEIEKVTGVAANVEYLPDRKLDVPVNVLDISRAYADIGWAPATSLDEGLKKTWQWLKINYQ